MEARYREQKIPQSAIRKLIKIEMISRSDLPGKRVFCRFSNFIAIIVVWLLVCRKQHGLHEKIKLIASRNSPYRSNKDPYWKKYYTSGEGYNYLMPHLLGSVARGQIERFKKKILVKKKHHELLEDLAENIFTIIFQNFRKIHFIIFII